MAVRPDPTLTEEIGRGMFWTPHNGGHWFINDYELLFEAARSPEIFSNQPVAIPPNLGQDQPLIPLEIDPPDHTRLRRMISVL